MKKRVTPKTITDQQIRDLHNGFVEGTGTDAIGRHLCHVALGECCVATGNERPMSMRYPTADEIKGAKSRLASEWNRRIR